MDKLPQLTAEELGMCLQTFRSFDKDGALVLILGPLRSIDAMPL